VPSVVFQQLLWCHLHLHGLHWLCIHLDCWHHVCGPQLIFVGDSFHQNVWVLHSTGLYIIRSIVSAVSVVNRFSAIASLCFTPDSKELYILDRFASGLEWATCTACDREGCGRVPFQHPSLHLS
jgi:hypothetical protein